MTPGLPTGERSLGTEAMTAPSGERRASAPPGFASDITENNLSGEETAALQTVDPVWAWTRYEPSAQKPWDQILAAHLYHRAGFGATWRELERAAARGPHATIDELLQRPATYAAFESEFEKHESAAAHAGDGLVLDAWWLRRMRESPWPLLEKLTLFWHGHFAIRSSAVADLKHYYAHLRLLRERSLSDGPSMFGALAQDPAMYLGLGGAQNRKAQPNLPFARPWLEAFSVGAKETADADVASLARAWTGWFVYSGKLRFVEREHDTGPKTLLGNSDVSGRDEALGILAAHPATARNLTRRLFRAFISESASPSDRLLAPLAEQLQRKVELVKVVEVMLRSNLFFSEHSLHQRIKSPVELAVGLVRSLAGAVPANAVVSELNNLGQRLDEPPTAHGWPGGTHWLNTVTLAARVRLGDSILRGGGVYGKGLDPAKVLEEAGGVAAADHARRLMDILLGCPLTPETAAQLQKQATAAPESLKTVAGAIIAEPQFQLC